MKFKQCNVVVSEPLNDTALNWVFGLNFDWKFVTWSFLHLNQFKKTETRQNPPKVPPKITRHPPLHLKTIPPKTRHPPHWLKTSPPQPAWPATFLKWREPAEPYLPGGGVPTHTKSKWYTFQYYLGVFFITILTFFIHKITVLSVFHSRIAPDLHLFHR